MAEKPPEEGYISVVDEEPELLELLKWDAPQVQNKIQEVQPCQGTAEKRNSKARESDPFDLPEPTFIETYRLSKDLTKSLCEELKPVMPDKGKPLDFPVESKVLAALSYFANGKFQKSVCKQTDPSISQYLMSNAVTQVTEAMNHPTIVKKYIHFPHLSEERDLVKTRFYVKFGMPNVVGCIDCMHVPIAKPDDDQKSHNNKSYYSKKVQIICDSENKIISVDPYPGSYSHDSILNKHPVRVDLQSMNHNEQCWLIGGPYYTLKNYVMTPIPKIPKKSAPSPEKYYNDLHTQTHNTVLNTIKYLKGRWKCLQANCNKQFDPAMVSMMIVACCILHNICLHRGLAIVPLTSAEERLETMKLKVANGAIPKKLNDDEDGILVRTALVQRLWSEKRLAPVSYEPKKRMSKKQKPVENHHNINQGQGHVQSLHCQQEDASKRARMAPAPQAPTYALLQPTWPHYTQHH